MTDIVVDPEGMSRARTDVEQLGAAVESDAFYPDYLLPFAPIAVRGRDSFIEEWDARRETELGGIEAMVLGFDLVQRAFVEADQVLRDSLDALGEIELTIGVDQ